MLAEIALLLMQASTAQVAPTHSTCKPEAELRAAEPDAEVAVREKAIMGQICVEDARAARAEQLRLEKADAAKPANVEQLADDLELSADQEAPEAHMVRKQQSPEERLYRDVADVWETIRRRGQQPTPELIAREIGPDALARFLDQNPGAEAAFGQDSDTLPVPSPEDLDTMTGGVFTLPAPDSGA